jgi:V-type H+-transporting ATPase proteolipid subunit
MSGIIAVYGLVVSVLIAGASELFYDTVNPSIQFIQSPAVKPADYSLFAGLVHLGAGLACGFTGIAAGYAIGFVGDSVSGWHS